MPHSRQDPSFDESAYRGNIRWLSGCSAAGLFATGGTGKFFSRTPTEVETVVTAAVAEAPRDLHALPVTGHDSVLLNFSGAHAQLRIERGTLRGPEGAGAGSRRVTNPAGSHHGGPSRLGRSRTTFR
ncbi:hypothetical protein [Actinopolyspora halophila]|uniref:hypothetical protein n=1 Tax=Actinopolyspora halophila TaxID=1850 RepID=UPI00036F438E|nr:hypothetical protein [Actinopolyspora halophila]